MAAVTTSGRGPIGYHRELLDLLLLLRQGRNDPSLRKISSMSSVSVAHLSGIFAAKTVPSPEVAVALARSLGADADQLANARKYAEGAARDRSAARTDEAAPIVSLPKPPSRTFVGREGELARLDASVEAGLGVVSSVHGLGGVGKSELALQYASTHRSRYRLIWWISADSPTAIEAGLVALALRLHPDARPGATTREHIARCVGWLQHHDRWLLVLDNVERLADIEPLLGQCRTGHVLVTTRRDIGWQHVADRCVWLDMLSPAHSAKLISQRTDTNDAANERLAEALGRLPLALVQAAGYIAQTRTAAADYLQLLLDRPNDMLDARAEGDVAESAVARVWTLTLEAIAARNPCAVELLRLAAFFAPDAIPRDLLASARKDPLEANAALGLLASYSMIGLAADAVSVHRLVQAVVRGSDPDPAATRATALVLLRQALPPGDPDTAVSGWPRWDALVPHVDALAGAFGPGEAAADLSFVLTQAGAFHHAKGAFRREADSYQRALSIDEQLLGAEHADLAERLDRFAGALRSLGRPREAEPLRRRALAISQVAFTGDHPDLATRLDSLGGVLRDLGQPAEAAVLQRQAAAMTARTQGVDHIKMASRLNNLACTLRALGEYADAERLQRDALAISERVLGPDHWHVAVRIGNLALCLSSLGRPDEAEVLHRRALAIGEAALGPAHPSIATRLNNLGRCLQSLGRAAEAEDLHWRALHISETAHDPDHPSVAVMLDGLGTALCALGRPGEAEACLRRAFEISLAAYGPDHPVVADRRGALAVCCATLSRGVRPGESAFESKPTGR